MCVGHDAARRHDDESDATHRSTPISSVTSHQDDDDDSEDSHSDTSEVGV